MASMSLQAAYDQARQWLETNDLDRTIGLAQHILNHYPDNLEAYRILGEAYLANRQLDSAQEAFERVLRSDPENIPAHVGLGITYERQGKLDRAVSEFEQALEIKPDMAELRSQLLRLYADAWGGDKAQLRLSRAGLARLYAKGYMLPQAITEFRQVIADQPGRFDAMVALAEALWRDGQEDEAITLCRDILAKQPQSLKANLILGYLEMASGQPDGERFWQAARQTDPYQVVARAMFDTLPPDNAGEPTIEEWDEAAWRQRQIDEQQEQMPATRPMEAVTPVGTPVVDTFRSSSWRDQPPPRPARAAPPAADQDDFLAGLLAISTPPSAPEPAPAPGAPDEDVDLDMTPFSLDDLDVASSAPSAPPAPERPVAPSMSEDEPVMKPFSLNELGLSEEEIAGLESLDSVPAAPAQPSQSEELPGNEEDMGMQPFSLADLGLSEEEIAGLDSLHVDTGGPSPLDRPKTLSAPDLSARETPRSPNAPSGDEEQLDIGDLPSDLQPFSLDELDLGRETPSDAGGDQLPHALQPFSLEDPPPQRPRVSGFAAQESFESVSDEEDFIPQTGGYSWQQPTQKPEPGFLKPNHEEAESSGDISIFAKLKQRREQTPEAEPPAAPPASVDRDEDLGLFSLDDISLRDDAPNAPDQPSLPAGPPAFEEVESLQEAIETGMMQPFSLADLGLSEEEIAALGLSDTAAPTAMHEAESATDESISEVASPTPGEGLDAGAARDNQPPAPVQAAPQPAQAEPAPVAEEGDEVPLLTSELKPFSLSDLGLSEEEISALGLGPSFEPEEEIGSELGITEEELEGLDLVDLNWSQAQPAASPPPAAPAPEPQAPAGYEPQTTSGDLVLDRLIALGRQQGYVDISDIMAGFEDPEAEAARIEEIGRALHEAKVEIRDGDEIVDLDAEYAEEEAAASASAPAEQDEEPAMTPFSLSELGLTDEEIDALGLGETPAAEASPAAEPPIPFELETPSAPAERDEEPVMTPFSLSELGLTDEEIDALGLDEPPAAEAPPAAETPAPFELETPSAPAERDEEPAMTPFSLSELGLTDEEIGALGLGETPAAEAPISFELETPSAPAERDEEPVMTPFSLSELGLTDEEIAALGLGEPPAEAPPAAEPPIPFELETPSAPTAERDEEPAMTPFSLSELGLTDEEIDALEPGTPVASETVAEGIDTPAPEAFVAPAVTGQAEQRVPEPEPPAATVPEPEPPVVAPPAPPPRARESRVPAAAPGSAPAGRRPSSNDVLDTYLNQLEADPQNDALRLSVARIGAQIGMSDLAAQQYKQLIRHDVLLDEIVDDLTDLISETDDQQMLQRLHRMLGDAYSRQGRFSEAIEAYSWKLGEPRSSAR